QVSAGGMAVGYVVAGYEKGKLVGGGGGDGGGLGGGDEGESCSEPEAVPLPERPPPENTQPSEKVIVVSSVEMLALPLLSGPDVAVNVSPDCVPEMVPPPPKLGPPIVPNCALKRLEDPE